MKDCGETAPAPSHWEKDGILLNLLGSLSYSDELTHYWRRSGDEYVQSEDIRFPQVMGYARIMESALDGLLKKFDIQPRDFAKVVIDAPDTRSHQGLMKRFGFDPKTQVQDLMHSSDWLHWNGSSLSHACFCPGGRKTRR